MKIMSVVGARPNFMKVAPIVDAIREHNRRGGPLCIQHVLVHTGQHYDPAMSGSFFEDLGLPCPNAHLGVGSGSHATQTAEIMKKFEGVLAKEKPDALVVVGDVNSTVACALVAAKISFDEYGSRPLIAHVEAGLRSFDRTMPEEVNRVLTDQLADLLFVTERSALGNLAREGVAAEKVHFVGNTMIDSLLRFLGKAEDSKMIEELDLRDHASGTIRLYVLLTLHRPANVDCREAFSNILEGLQGLAGEYAIVFPTHPRTQKSIQALGLEHYFEAPQGPDKLPVSRAGDGNGKLIRMIRPLSYLDFVCLMKSAQLVVTDSGGVQEETTCLGVPCVTVRENTERPVTIEHGTNVLAGVTEGGIRRAVQRQLAAQSRGSIPEKWDGQSAVRILEVLTQELQTRISARAGSPSSRLPTQAAVLPCANAAP